MHEINMDKKKKNEDDKEVIDFMELVEENLSSINETEKTVENDLFENKPLQLNSEVIENNIDSSSNSSSNSSNSDNNIEVITEEVLNDLREAVEGSFTDKEDENEELRFLNEKVEKMAMESIIDNKKSSGTFKKEIFKEKYNGNNDNNDKLDDTIDDNNDDNNDKLDNKYNDNINKKNNKDYVTDNTSLILRKDDSLELKPDHLRIKKYPGLLYIDIYSIEKYISSDTEVESVFVRLETKDFVYETGDHPEESTIKINSLVNIKLEGSDTFNIRFILNKRTNTGIIKSSECVVKIDKDFLDKIHNTLFEINYEWAPYSSNNFFKSFISFFQNEVVDAWGLKLFFSFISIEELEIIKYIPNTTYNSISNNKIIFDSLYSLYDLGKFLKIRKYAYNTWFTGFCNIRGFNTDICTHLWKRRFIKIHGYKVFIYNEHTKNLLGVFDLLSTMSKERDIFENNNKFRIINNERMIEFHLESTEKYLQFKRVMEALL